MDGDTKSDQIVYNLSMPKNSLRIFIIVLLILLIPFFGNIFVEGWDWGVFDFIFAGAILFVVGLSIDCVIRRVKKPFYKFLAVAAIVLVFIALWVEMAVDGVSRLIDSLL